jgi:hypothetical protein
MLEGFVGPEEAPEYGDEPSSEDPDPSVRCTSCLSGKQGDKLLLCDHGGCQQAWHLYCLDPPLKAIPKGDWFCPVHAPPPGIQPASDARLVAVPAESPEHHRFDGDSPSGSVEPSTNLSEMDPEEPSIGEDGSDDSPAEEEPAGGGPAAQRPRPIWDDWEVLEYLCSKKYPIDPTLWEAGDTRDVVRLMQRITKRASRYVWEADGRLYRLSVDKTHRVRVPKPTERPELIAAIHDMGHLGFTKTYSVVRRRFWWECMRQDVAEYVRNCEKYAGGPAEASTQRTPAAPAHRTAMAASPRRLHGTIPGDQ